MKKKIKLLSIEVDDEELAVVVKMEESILDPEKKDDQGKPLATDKKPVTKRSAIHVYTCLFFSMMCHHMSVKRAAHRTFIHAHAESRYPSSMPTPIPPRWPNRSSKRPSFCHRANNHRFSHFCKGCATDWQPNRAEQLLCRLLPLQPLQLSPCLLMTAVQHQNSSTRLLLQGQKHPKLPNSTSLRAKKQLRHLNKEQCPHRRLVPARGWQARPNGLRRMDRKSPRSAGCLTMQVSSATT